MFLTSSLAGKRRPLTPSMEKLQRVQTHTDPSDDVAGRWFSHSSGKRYNSDALIYDAIKNVHPGLEVTVVPTYNVNLKAYAAEASSDAYVQEVDHHHQWPSGLKWTEYYPPTKRLEGGDGVIVESAKFEKFLYRWKNHEYLVYYAEGDGEFQMFSNQYIVNNDVDAVHLLIKTIGRWESQVHNQIWVFDQGFWSTDGELYNAIQKSSWDDIILDRSLKEDLIETLLRFFKSRKQYEALRVPWKRGIIFYGPPGNGKTVSIKATMHTLYQRSPPIPTLYVKSLSSAFGREFSITQIFLRARREAPCYLVFEDLDSMVTPEVRSFFLNAVDGLSENEGILMVGSTNHLDKLDPGIAKRPSRFDRKYLFPNPNESQREKYCEYWQRKLKDSKEIEYPDKLNPAIAKITYGFSFAYIQEAYVSALLIIAGQQEDDDDEGKRVAEVDALEEQWETLDLEDQTHKDKDGDKDKDGPEKFLLYRTIKEQVAMLRKELEKDRA